MKSNKNFYRELKEKMRSLNMKNSSVHVFNIHAEFGTYQIVIGDQKKEGREELEIKGEIHHLFLSDDGLQTSPTRSQVSQNLKGMLVLRGLKVHLKDPDGDGMHLSKEHEITPSEVINLAGNKGDQMIKSAMKEERLYQQAYDIIQSDILHSLDRKGEETEHTFESKE